MGRWALRVLTSPRSEKGVERSMCVYIYMYMHVSYVSIFLGGSKRLGEGISRAWSQKLVRSPRTPKAGRRLRLRPDSAVSREGVPALAGGGGPPQARAPTKYTAQALKPEP